MDNLKDTIEEIRSSIENASPQTEEQIEAFRIKYLGRRQGLIQPLFDRIPELPPEQRPDVGKTLNALKQLAEQKIETARKQLEEQSSGAGPEGLDLTLPGRRPFEGSVHPITQTLEEIERIFKRFGFDVAEGPEIEDEWHNFSALNFPPDHPARDMQDTFFLSPPPPEGEETVLRTHTSPVQIRVMENEAPPVRIIAPGRVYRNEAISYKSFCLFYQIEGLYVDEGVTFGDLKELLHLFASAFFGSDVRMRFRPSYFPFTEPSAEVDIWWADETNENGGRWLEVLGCGMVDPSVLEAVNVDPERYTGYAFGLGVDRIAMLDRNIEDIRILYENDIRFLQQF
jgi:phenylalanyl-tRNA synthetase alpha chain